MRQVNHELAQMLDDIVQHAGALWFAATASATVSEADVQTIADVRQRLLRIVVAGPTGSPTVTVVAHPTMWATVLRVLTRAHVRRTQRLRRQVAAGTVQASAAAVSLAGITMAAKPIADAVHAALHAHPTWRRWFSDAELKAMAQQC